MSAATSAHPVITEAKRAKSLGKPSPYAMLLRQVLERTGVTQAEVARLWDCDQRHVSDVVRGRKVLHVRYIRALPEPARSEFLRALGREVGGAWIDLPEREASPQDVAEQAASLTEASSALEAAVLRAIADGRIDGTEGAEIEERGWALVYEGLGWVALGKLAQDERIIGVEW